MKIPKYTFIITFILFLHTEGQITTNWTVEEGETFIFHLPKVETGFRKAEWKQQDRNKLLALVDQDNVNETVIIWQDGRVNFLQNGTIIIRDVRQEDTGNYSCKVIFKSNRIQTHVFSLTVYSESNGPSSPRNATYSTPESKEPSSPHNATSATPVPWALILQIVIPAFGGLLLLTIVSVVILKCRRNDSTRSIDEHIYSNTYCVHKTNQTEHNKKDTCAKKH